MKFLTVIILLAMSLLTLQAGSRILIAPGATPYEEFAAGELQQVWLKSTGVKPDIVTDGAPKAGDMVVGTADTPHVKKVYPRLGLSPERKHELAVYELDGVLYLTGQTPRAVVDSTFLFLRENVGVRWLWPGKDGEFIPEHQAISFTGVKRNLNPDFTQRTIRLCGYEKRPVDFELFLSRNFATYQGCSQYDLPHKGNSDLYEFIISRSRRCGMGTVYSGHVAFHEVPLKERPELYALREGKRSQDQLCWSQPDNAKLVAGHLIKMGQKFNYGINEYSLSVHDNESYCQCADCLASLKEGGGYSRIYFRFADAVARGIKQQQPGAIVGSLAYLAYASEPGIKLNDLDWVEHCPWSRCYSHTTKECGANTSAFAMTEKWRKTGIDVAIYGYYFDSISPVVALPWGNLIADEIRRYRDMGVYRLAPELILGLPKTASAEFRNSVTFRLSIYLYLHLMLQPDTPVETLIRDWCRTAYGRAAEEDMVSYHMTLLAGADKVKSHMSGVFCRPNQVAEEIFAVPGLMEHCETMLKNAESKLTESRYRDNLKREKRLYADLKKVAISTLHESFTPVPLRQDSKSPLNARLGASGASVYYNTEEIVLQLTSDSELFLATPSDESSGEYRTFRPAPGSGEIRIPFHSLGVAPPLAGEAWRIGVRNGRKFHPEKLQNKTELKNLGYLVFTPEIVDPGRRLLILPDKRDFEKRTPAIFRDTAHKYGFSVDFAFDAKGVERDLSDYDVILLKLDTVSPSPEFFKGPLRQAAKRGALVILAGENFVTPAFGSPEYGFKTVAALNSPTIKVAPDAAKHITAPRKIEPGNSYPAFAVHIPERPEKWQVFYSALDKDQKEQPIMLFRREGKGGIIVTSCPMGLNHGWRLFGDLAPDMPQSTFHLILNLLGSPLMNK